MDIDEQLLNQNTEFQEADRAGEFRASKRGVAYGEGAQNLSLRESLQQKRLEESKQKKDRDETGKIPDSSSGINPILKATDSLLKFSWENLIDSFGLTLIWINIHVFLNQVLGPKVFRDVGEEWLPDSIKKVAGKSKQAAALLKTVEGAGIGCLDLGCLIILLLILTVICIIASALSGDLSILLNLLKAGLESLFSIFS